MDEMEKLLQSMTKMKDGMEAMQKELVSYIIKHEEGGVSLEVQGDGIIKNLKFTNSVSPHAVELAINNANSKMKAFISKKINAITPPELREAAAPAA